MMSVISSRHLFGFVRRYPPALYRTIGIVVLTSQLELQAVSTTAMGVANGFQPVPFVADAVSMDRSYASALDSTCRYRSRK